MGDKLTDDEGVVDLLHTHDVVVRFDQAPLGGHLDGLLQQRLTCGKKTIPINRYFTEGYICASCAQQYRPI